MEAEWESTILINFCTLKSFGYGELESRWINNHISRFRVYKWCGIRFVLIYFRVTTSVFVAAARDIQSNGIKAERKFNRDMLRLTKEDKYGSTM